MVRKLHVQTRGDREVCNGNDMFFAQWDGMVRQCACVDAPIIGDVLGGYDTAHAGECALGRPSPH